MRHRPPEAYRKRLGLTQSQTLYAVRHETCLHAPGFGQPFDSPRRMRTQAPHRNHPPRLIDAHLQVCNPD
jgi:hypothetical protein